MKRNPPTFALAGQLVSTVPHATRILVDAMRNRKLWLVPQAESVIRKIREAKAVA